MLKLLRILVDISGNLYFNQHMDAKKFTSLNVSSIPLCRGKGVKVLPPKPRALSFTTNGEEFLFLNGNVVHFC